MVGSPSLLSKDEMMMKTYAKVANSVCATKEGVTPRLVVQVLLVIVTHDAEMLSNADRVLIMRDGRAEEWVEGGDLVRARSLAS